MTEAPNMLSAVEAARRIEAGSLTVEALAEACLGRIAERDGEVGAFIHIDPERAAQTPFGGTVAHGFLTLSMLVHLSTSIPSDFTKLEGVLMGVNYGLNKVRFVNPVPAGSRIRATASTVNVELKGNAVDQTRAMTVEIEGADKPALIAEWIGRTVFA